jgi:hypothetical protein
MSSPSTSRLLRIAGTFAAAVGAILAAFVLWRVATALAQGVGLAILLGGLLALVVPAFLFYAGFLIWRRPSPLAVQHVCGAIAFLLFWIAVTALPPGPAAENPSAWFILPVAVGLYVGYRRTSLSSTRSLFPSGAPSGIAN